MPLGKFQKGLRICEGVSLERRKATTLALWQPYPTGAEKVRAAARASATKTRPLP